MKYLYPISGGVGSSLLNPSLPNSQYVGNMPFPLIKVLPLYSNWYPAPVSFNFIDV